MSDFENDDSDGELSSNEEDLRNVVQIRDDLKKVQSSASKFEHGFEGVTKSLAAKPSKSGKRKATDKSQKQQKRASKRKSETNPSTSSPAQKVTRKTNGDDTIVVDDDGNSFWKCRQNSKSHHLKAYFDVDKPNSSEDKNVMATCKLCKQSLGCKSGNNSNLMSHLYHVSFVVFYHKILNGKSKLSGDLY